MYKVLYPPELWRCLPNCPMAASAALVYDGKRGLRALMYSIAKSEQKQKETQEKFELAALLLNQPPSLSVQKLRLRSIVSVIRRADEARRAEAQFRSSAPSNFRADFGRMDIGLNPGWGRD